MSLILIHQQTDLLGNYGWVSRAIPTLLRGVSQAADSTKQADHADIQDNANSNPVQGLSKRSGSQFITTLSNSAIGNVHIQTINRDLAERYVAIFRNWQCKSIWAWWYRKNCKQTWWHILLKYF